ncbi:hypothetical protein [Teredinibacter turnerae]|uniref:hypothetical protein n=1 Tax=Teredinibacter turnerae TaxID=2426 RepID=UPI000365A3D7|nr:hypothetical protein [Teredinibacter turnerae]
MTIKFADVGIPEAERLADWYGILEDLKAARRLCNSFIRVIGKRQNSSEGHLTEEYEDIHEQFMAQMDEVDALFITAVMRYMRCFKSGVRTRLHPSYIDSLSDELQGAHRYFELVRDKHIAHSVSVLESHSVTVQLEARDGVLQPAKHLSLGGPRVAFAEGDAYSLRALAESMIVRAYSIIEKEEMNLLNLLNSWPIEKLHSLQLQGGDMWPRRDAETQRQRAKVVNKASHSDR